MIRALVALLLVGGGAAQAAPLVYFTLEGRAHGSDDAFTGNVEVQLGDTVEYRLRASMAPEGTLNQHVSRNAPGSSPGKHGMNSLSVAIRQDALEPIQVDLSSTVEFAGPSSPSANDSWGWSWATDYGSHAKPGTPSPRPGSTLNDLLGIRPLHAPGIFTLREPEVVFTGLFNVALVSGASGVVAAGWGPVSGGGWHRGDFVIVTSLRESGLDPITHFTPLTLTATNFEVVPEPSTFALLGAAVIGFALLGRSRVVFQLRPRDLLKT